jgi:hypothetical protein
MFTREIMQRIESYFSQSGPNITRLEGVARGVLTVLQLLIASLAIPAQLWNAGVGKAIEIAAEDGKPAGSQYTRRWWLALQMALAVFTVAMKTPVNVLASLETAEGVRPFAVFDPETVAPEFVGMTLELLVFSDPETVAPVVEQVIEPVIEPGIPA